MARRRLRRRGFSILELAVVGATISVIASIAIPRLTHAFKRARAVEAAQTMGAIERSLREYYNRTGEYPPSAARNPPLDNYDKAQMDTDLPGWRDLGFKPDASYRYRYQFTSTPDSSGRNTTVVLEAMADTDNDGRVAHFLRVFKFGEREFQADENDQPED
jgi:type II secretory pathway pseudopilin PulG